MAAVAQSVWCPVSARLTEGQARAEALELARQRAAGCTRDHLVNALLAGVFGDHGIEGVFDVAASTLDLMVEALALLFGRDGLADSIASMAALELDAGSR
jgi:hypothetical protein